MDQLIQEIVNYLLASQYAPYAVLAIGVFYVISHIVAMLPERIYKKIPSWLLWLINKIAANYKNTRNAKWLKLES